MIAQSHDPATCHCDHCRNEQALIDTGGWEWVDEGRPARIPKSARRYGVWYVVDAIVLGWVIVLLWLAFGG